MFTLTVWISGVCSLWWKVGSGTLKFMFLLPQNYLIIKSWFFLPEILLYDISHFILFCTPLRQAYFWFYFSLICNPLDSHITSDYLMKLWHCHHCLKYQRTNYSRIENKHFKMLYVYVKLTFSSTYVYHDCECMLSCSTI